MDRTNATQDGPRTPVASAKGQGASSGTRVAEPLPKSPLLAILDNIEAEKRAGGA